MQEEGGKMPDTATAFALPAGFTIRAPRIVDAAEVASVVNARSIAVSGSPSVSVDDILFYWNDPERDLTSDDWLVIAADGQIVAFMEFYRAAPYTVADFDLFVHPDFTGIGIEQTLIGVIEARAQKDLPLAPSGESVTLRTFAPSTDVDRHQLFNEFGYQHIRDGLEMLIDLQDLQHPRGPDGITVRPLIRDQDERAVWETAEAAWVDHWGYNPMPFEEFRYYRIEAIEDFDPTLWHLAMDGDRIAGVALCRASGGGKENTGWVSLLGVRREYRGRGIGLALLQHVFVDFKHRGYEHVALGVDASSLTGADRLYRRAGMREVKREFIFEKLLVEPTA
jgi:ribosomal protein S18 acetylase RimI-like enzyme